MITQLQPRQLLLLILAGAINPRHQDAIEYLHRMILFRDRAVQSAAVAFPGHYHRERNHQGMDNGLIEPGEEVRRSAGEVACRERIGGMLRYQRRKAA
jgi:hypothetical protein